jgi:flavin reductase (DIM6/NTAB) family NADH-FMN oxidoreductase RutF
VSSPGFDQRELFRRWPAGVCVVAAASGGRRAGLTVSSLVSLSLDPPLVVIALSRSASLYEVLREAGEWGVSLLAGDQEHVAKHFARNVPPIAQ